MSRRILIINGHPDAGHGHFCDALVEAYATGARMGGHAVDLLEVAGLDFPLLHRKEDWDHDEPPEAIGKAQARITQADHLVIVYPLWLGCMPALLKGFLEQVLRPGFAFGTGGADAWTKQLRGKSARIVVTMGMPGAAYRWFYRAHGLKLLQRNILAFCGIGPIAATLVGRVESGGSARRDKALATLHAFGRQGA